MCVRLHQSLYTGAVHVRLRHLNSITNQLKTKSDFKTRHLLQIEVRSADVFIKLFNYTASAYVYELFIVSFSRMLLKHLENPQTDMLTRNNNNELYLLGHERVKALQSILERFSFECRKVIGFAFSRPHDWSRN